MATSTSYITGHSYLPSERVFGHIEREVKRKEVIIQPQEYHNIIANHATLIVLGSNECQVFEWKGAVEKIPSTTVTLPLFQSLPKMENK